MKYEWHGIDRRAAAIFRRQGADWTMLTVSAYHVLPGMTSECRACKAMRFVGEPPAICCLNGKVVLPHTPDAPEPLTWAFSNIVNIWELKCPLLGTSLKEPSFNGLLIEQNTASRRFRENIRSYNSALSLASSNAIFVCTHIFPFPSRFG
jgi:hypothetical protein